MKNKTLVLLILLIWFVISFITNILGPIMPAIIATYHLNLTLAGFLPFSFFLAFGIMSIPSSIILEKFGAKTSLLTAFSMILIGSLLFSFFPIYTNALISLFVIGIGMAMLQVVITPMMRIAGGEQNFAFYAVLSQLVFGLGSFLSPKVYTFFVSDSGLGFEWYQLYWLFSLVTFCMLVIFYFKSLPFIQLKREERAGTLAIYRGLWRKRMVKLYFLGMVSYVGIEQGVSNWISTFLEMEYRLNPEFEGAETIMYYWGMMSVGALVGLILLRLVDQRVVLKYSSICTIITLVLALFGRKDIALICFPLVGFFISCMYSIVFSLALNSTDENHGAFSGIICTGIFGGSLIPLMVGAIGDIFELKIGMSFIIIPIIYLFVMSLWAKPIIHNKKIV